MSTVSKNLTLRVDSELKQEAEQLFADLGLNLSTAFNMFLRQAIRVQGLPFEVVRDVPNRELKLAMAEAEHLAVDGSMKGHSSVESLIEDLNA